jgi:Tfp pilus assembly protein PilN
MSVFLLFLLWVVISFQVGYCLAAFLSIRCLREANDLLHKQNIALRELQQKVLQLQQQQVQQPPQPPDPADWWKQ